MSRDLAGIAPGAGGGLGTPQAERGVLARRLAGELCCARCSYDLKGLSVRGVCPECATPIRATLLVMVDPLASELRPIEWPRRVAWGLVAWTGFALAGVVGAAVAGVVPLVGSSVPYEVGRTLVWVVIGCASASGVGAAMSLLWPHRGIRPEFARLALAGVLMYVPLVACVWLAAHAPASAARWASLACLVLMAGILVALRPVARILQARSMLLRTNQVDRQTMRVLALAAGIAAIGELARLIAASGARVWSDVVGLVGGLVVAAVWALVVLGLFGMLADSWRLRRVILQPPLSHERVFGKSRAEDASSSDAENSAKTS